MATRKAGVNERDTLLSKTVKTAREIASEGDREPIAQFIPAYYAGTSTEDLHDHGATELAGAALAHFTLASERQRLETVAHVF
ncbi:MAG: hypothetical protein ACRER1_02250, partial [Gammaproteobacteria bacterium]